MPPPLGWATWESGDGVRVATPAELRPQPIPGASILRTDHGGTRYQVSVGIDPPEVTGPFQPAEAFEAFLENFAASGGFRRDGPTERLRVGGRPAAQVRFRDGDLRGYVITYQHHGGSARGAKRPEELKAGSPKGWGMAKNSHLRKPEDAAALDRC